jgi:hypothetical protein
LHEISWSEYNVQKGYKMSIIEKNKQVIDELYAISNPILKHLIEKDFYKKETQLSAELINNDLVQYWLNIFDGNGIHGGKDTYFENAISKLLLFGLTSANKEFDNVFSPMLEANYWTDDVSFNNQLNKIVLYPFLIRAGYLDNNYIKNFLEERIILIENFIKKYGYNFEAQKMKRPQKYNDEFIFANDITQEWFPTIYDLYAFAFYPIRDDKIYSRIEKIVEYLIDEKFQNIPDPAFLYDESNKRYYAAGQVFCACMKEDRKLLMLFLLSHFKASSKSVLFKSELKKLLATNKDGFYEFDKSVIKEKKDSYFIYSGGHMGLGEKRSGKNWQKIESTYWMLKILNNIELNKIVI